MARTAPKPSDQDRLPPPKRSSWLRVLLRTLFARHGRAKRTDGKPAVTRDGDGASVQARRGKVATATMRSDNAMHAELMTLFQAAPGSRDALRHLAAVLHGLKHKDSKGLFLFVAEPVHVRNALRQLDGLMPKEPTPGLVALRARMVDAIGTRERRAKRLEMLSPRSDLMQSDRMQVSEASATDFDRALQR